MENNNISALFQFLVFDSIRDEAQDGSDFHATKACQVPNHLFKSILPVTLPPSIRAIVPYLGPLSHPKVIRERRTEGVDRVAQWMRR
jgi:hypothetical protein